MAQLSEIMQDDMFLFDHVLWQPGESWKPIFSCMVGMPDVVTPAHYDGMENLLAQVIRPTLLAE